MQNNIRTADNDDRMNLTHLIHNGILIHRHVDWRSPLDWLEQPESWMVFEENNKIVAALACPEHPPGVAWIRLFATFEPEKVRLFWESLWEPTSHILKKKRINCVACLLLQGWTIELLEKTGFQVHNHVTNLICRVNKKEPEIEKKGFTLRPMEVGDLEQVAQVDRESFDPIWQNTEEDLAIAYRQSVASTIIEYENKIVGYQLSTLTHMGYHLARLAVVPNYRGKGLGKWLILNLIGQAYDNGKFHITVNTQADNTISLLLYKKTGFVESGEMYPVYMQNIGIK
jgi:ribosomal-protein-alanine N-acetyltransferase